MQSELTQPKHKSQANQDMEQDQEDTRVLNKIKVNIISASPGLHVENKKICIQCKTVYLNPEKISHTYLSIAY